MKTSSFASVDSHLSRSCDDSIFVKQLGEWRDGVWIDGTRSLENLKVSGAAAQIAYETSPQSGIVEAGDIAPPASST